MNNVNKYVKAFEKIRCGEIKAIRGYGKVYRSTNEHLNEILSHYSLKDKSVLSVVASSDQVFSSYYLGASEVDTFDSNIFAYFYFFLKKWNLMHNGRSYIPASNYDLIQSLEEHNNSDIELFIYEFWRKVFESLREPLYYSEFFYRDSMDRTLPYDGDEEVMAKIISDKIPHYEPLNLFKKFKLDKKYDVVILSNILEYMYDEEDPRLEKIVSDNLYNLVNDDGIIISSNILDCDYSGNPIFEDRFTYEEGPVGNYIYYKHNGPLCYTYKKRHN